MMEKKLGVTLKQSYVNRVTAILNNGMIPPGNSYRIHKFLLGKSRPGEEIRTRKKPELGWLLQAVLQGS